MADHGNKARKDVCKFIDTASPFKCTMLQTGLKADSATNTSLTAHGVAMSEKRSGNTMAMATAQVDAGKGAGGASNVNQESKKNMCKDVCSVAMDSPSYEELEAHKAELATKDAQQKLENAQVLKQEERLKTYKAQVESAEAGLKTANEHSVKAEQANVEAAKALSKAMEEQEALSKNNDIKAAAFQAAQKKAADARLKVEQSQALATQAQRAQQDIMRQYNELKDLKTKVSADKAAHSTRKDDALMSDDDATYKKQSEAQNEARDKQAEIHAKQDALVASKQKLKKEEAAHNTATATAAKQLEGHAAAQGEAGADANDAKDAVDRGLQGVAQLQNATDSKHLAALTALKDKQGAALLVGTAKANHEQAESDLKNSKAKQALLQKEIDHHKANVAKGLAMLDQCVASCVVAYDGARMLVYNAGPSIGAKYGALAGMKLYKTMLKTAVQTGKTVTDGGTKTVGSKR
jgi:hypothetical protein